MNKEGSIIGKEMDMRKIQCNKTGRRPLFSLFGVSEKAVFIRGKTGCIGIIGG